jgi:hypothetical protein
VRIAPEFACDVKVFTFYHSFRHFGLDRVANFFFISVQMGAVDVTVSGVDGVFDSLDHLPRLGLAKNGQESCVIFYYQCVQ